MASSIIIIHYLMIISIASSISSISGRYRKPVSENLMYDLVNLYDLNEKKIDKNEYQYVRPQNPEPAPPAVFMDSEDKTLENYLPSRPDNRVARVLEDNNIICEISITKGVFFQEGYDFFPREYINKTCVYSKGDPYRIDTNSIRKPEMCLHNDNDFGCQTLYEELRVFRRRNNSHNHECWERFIQPVAVGCKCNIRFTYNY